MEIWVLIIINGSESIEKILCSAKCLLNKRLGEVAKIPSMVALRNQNN